MDDFINYFRKVAKEQEKAEQKKTSAKSNHTKAHKNAGKSATEKKSQQPAELVENAKQMINHYRDNYADIEVDVLCNLMELKETTKRPKSEHPNKAFNEIKDHLGEAETGETLRQERWARGVVCPACKSTHIKRLKTPVEKNNNLHKYKCLDCSETFNDDSGTAFENDVPPLYSWMFCWYLLGCTDSLQYIATKLHLEIATIEMMIRYMQKLFKAERPLINFMTFEEWSLVHGKAHQALMKAELSKKSELVGLGYSLGQEQDTHEVRRKKERAENPQHKTPGGPKLKKRT